MWSLGEYVIAGVVLIMVLGIVLIAFKMMNK